MSKLPATKAGTIGKGVIEQLLLDAPMPENVEPRIYCFPRLAVRITEWAPQRVTIENVGAGGAVYMLVYATAGIVAFESFARATVLLGKAWRDSRGAK